MRPRKHRGPTSGGQSCPDAAAEAGQLCWDQLIYCAKLHGDSFYLYDDARFRENFARMSAAFTARYRDTRIAYSYKTNYMPAICKTVDELGGYAEVVSEMEYELARRLGIRGERIIYNGPYKSRASVKDALYAGAIVNLDSMRDYDMLMSIASQAPRRVFSVGLRCNFAVAPGSTSRFGFDAAGREFAGVISGICASRNVRLGGLHCHFPNRDLASFRSRTVQLLEIAARVFSSPPAFLDIGGGFFGEMPESLRWLQKSDPPEFSEYAETICGLLSGAYAHNRRKPTLYIEPGTALAADTLKFYTRVISIKKINGRSIATVAGSIFNISPHRRLRHLPVRVVRPPDDAVRADHEKYDIAGYTCIEDDYLTLRLPGPLRVGDFLEYCNVGSYSIVMKPPFILPNVAILGFARETGELLLIRKRESARRLFEGFAGL
jgi:diaminopimelate decarboxylase